MKAKLVKVCMLGMAVSMFAGMGVSVNASEETDEYLAQIQGDYVELFPELSKEENRATWEKYAAEYVDEDMVSDSVDMLLSMCMADIYGQEATDAYAEDPDSMRFDCYFLGDVKEFNVDGNTISGVDEDGNEVFSHTYKPMDMDSSSMRQRMKMPACSSISHSALIHRRQPIIWNSAMQTTQMTFRAGSKAIMHTGMQQRFPKIMMKR